MSGNFSIPLQLKKLTIVFDLLLKIDIKRFSKCFEKAND